jgi:RNA polymerase sigma factor (TIGR02999 family)
MKPVSSTSVSKLLVNWRQGDPDALGALMPLLYRELRRLAHSHLQGQRRDHTLQSTALVHEAYLKLMKLEDMDWQNRAHFFGVAAQVMRGILVDYARNRDAAKRGGGAYKLSLDEALGKAEQRELNLVALDDALKDLAEIDPRQSRIVELRFFGGLSIEETSEVLGVSPATTKREWAAARTWLYRQMPEASG